MSGHLHIQVFTGVLFRAEEMEIVFPVFKKSNKDNNYRTIDGFSFLTEDIVGEAVVSLSL